MRNPFLLLSILILLDVQHLSAATVPLPDWTYSVSGPPGGSGSASTNDRGGITFRVHGPPSGFGTELVQATSATDILTVSPNTIYTFGAWVGGGPPAGISMGLLVNGTGV